MSYNLKFKRPGLFPVFFVSELIVIAVAISDNNLSDYLNYSEYDFEIKSKNIVL